jgi:4-hydroxy-tetrahydrodipicolinate synthase
VVEAADGKVGVIMGVQTTRQRDLITLVKGAERLGCLAVQASAPFYEVPTEDDVIEWLAAIADHSSVGVVFYATPWTGFHTSLKLVERLVETPNVVAIKWYSPDQYVFERAMREYSRRIMFIDNSLQFVFAHLSGAGGLNLHVGNYWPQWAQRFWDMLEAGQYADAQREMTRVVQPYYDMCAEVSRFTGGEGHIDKLCLEYVGLEGGRCRPPTRDIRSRFGERVRQMAADCGVPKIE